MTRKSFAIVCDSTCDLPPEILSRLEVVCVPLGIEAGGRVLMDDADRDEATALITRHKSAEVQKLSKERILSVYQRLIDEGYDHIATVCTSLSGTGSWGAAEQAIAELGGGPCVLRTVDAGVASVGLGMVVERLVARARALAREVRFLFIPSSSASFVRGELRGRKNGLMARASSLRLRVIGERTLYLLTRGEATAIARSTDLSNLCGRAAHAMSSIAAQEGDLVYAVMGMDGSKTLRTLEKPLDTNEFCSMRLGRGRTAPSILVNTGADVAGVAFAPYKRYLEAGAGGPLPKGIIYPELAPK